MTVDAILQQVERLTAAERVELAARLRAGYDDKGNPLPDRADKTGEYSVAQLVARARRSE